jgi:peptidoglycan/LPS O-acetylase OafA/YrhL
MFILTLLSVQYLRGVAALLVVFYHCFVQLGRFGYAGGMPGPFASGVDIFFVISGFIMWHTTCDGTVGTLEFWKRRVIRIVPLYWLVTTVYVAILLIAPGYMQSARFDLYHVAASYFFIPVIHPVATQFVWPLVVPGWTLNYEMFFYLLFGLTLPFRNEVRAIGTVTLLIAIVCLRAFDLQAKSIFDFYTSSIILEFAFGVALGYLYSTGASVPGFPAILMVLAGIAGLALSSIFDIRTPSRAVTFGIPALLIVAGAVFYERSHQVTEVGLAKLLGDASYSIYLLHGAVLSALGQFWREVGWAQIPGKVVLFSLNAVVAAGIAGIVVYLLVERPLLRMLSRSMKGMLGRRQHIVATRWSSADTSPLGRA